MIRLHLRGDAVSLALALWASPALATPDPIATTTERLLGIDGEGRLLVQMQLTIHDPDGGPDQPPRDTGCMLRAPGADPVPLDPPACASVRASFHSARPVSVPWTVRLHSAVDPILLSLEHDGTHSVLLLKSAWTMLTPLGDTSLATSPEGPLDVQWFAAGTFRALSLAYFAPDPVGNSLPRTLWLSVPDPDALPPIPARPCAELRPGLPGAARRAESFEEIVIYRLRDRFEIVLGPPVEHERRLPQVMYKQDYALAARALAVGWRRADDHQTFLPYEDMRCALTVISASDGS